MVFGIGVSELEGSAKLSCGPKLINYVTRLSFHPTSTLGFRDISLFTDVWVQTAIRIAELNCTATGFFSHDLGVSEPKTVVHRVI